jgi:hypothetical protein
MKKIAISLLALVVTISAYGAYKTKSQKKKKKKVVQSASINNTNIKSVMMGRGACYGTCPVYTIEVFENGTMIYNGKNFVDKLGFYEKKISPKDAVDFIKKFNSLRPDTLAQSFEMRIPDLPTVYYFINYTDSVKHIFNADGGPIELKNFAKTFEDFVQFDDTWKKQIEKN